VAQALVRPHESKEQEYSFVLPETEPGSCLGARSRRSRHLAERRKNASDDTGARNEPFEIPPILVRVDEEAIAGSKCHAREREPDAARLVLDHVVADEEDSSTRAGLRRAGDRPELRRPERDPPGQDQGVGREASHAPRDAEPCQRIHRVERELDTRLGERACARIAIRGSRVEPHRVLPPEGEESDVVPLAQVTEEQRRVVRDTSAEWMGRADDRNLHH
jgi:hypothetical protein